MNQPLGRLLRASPRRYAAGAALLLALALNAGLGFWALNLRARQKALAAELKALEARAALRSAQLYEAERVRPTVDAFVAQTERLAQERQTGRWTAALRCVVEATGEATELQAVDVRHKRASQTACELCIRGVSSGPVPRSVADQFRMRLHAKLEEQFGGSVTTRFDQLEEQPASPNSSARRAAFVIAVAVGVTGQPQADGSEGI